MSQTLYIAGPMRGIDLFNFPAFDAAEAWFTAAGYKCINPARLDREAGFDPARDKPDDQFLCRAFARDLPHICQCDGMALLPGWQLSEGVTKVELPLAIMLGKRIICAISGLPLESETILDEAARLTNGDRDISYGHPSEHYARTVGMINARFDTSFRPEDWAVMMILDKIARSAATIKRDNLTDICGYARCWERILANKGHKGFVT